VISVYTVQCTCACYSEDGDIVWEPDDEMDEEIQAAFEQFLQMGKNQSKDTNSTDKCNG
jgi:hypothetical protein